MRLIDADVLKQKIDTMTIDFVNYKINLEAVYSAIRYAPTVGEWISVQDRLPDEEGCYLAYGAEAEGCDILAYDAANGDWISMGHTLADGEVTYWMPLPEPPKEGSSE